MSVTRADLVRTLAERMGETQKDTEKRVVALLEILAAAITDQGRVELRGFGAFEAREIKAQETINPRTGKAAQNFLLCVLELIQIRLKSGKFAVDDTLVEALYVQMERYLHAFGELGKSPVEDVSNNGYTDLMVDGAPSPHQSDTTLRWLIDRLRS